MTSTSSATAITGADRQHDALLRRYAIDVNAGNRGTLAAYRARNHRARWCGAIGAVVAGSAGLLGSSDSSPGLGLARLLVGYLVGSAVAEVLSPQRRATGHVHRASLVPRQPDLLLPAWARILPWVFLVPCLASPLLMIGHHPTGRVRIHTRTMSAAYSDFWFSSPVLITIAVLAAAGLVFWRLTLGSLVRRRLPVDDRDAARLDLLTRALSARAVSGSAAVLGMSMLGGLGELSSLPLHSSTCTNTPPGCHDLYAWSAASTAFSNAATLLLLSAILLFWFSRLSRVDASLLASAAERS